MVDPCVKYAAYADGSGTTADKEAGIGVVIYAPSGSLNEEGVDPGEIIAECSVGIGPGSNNLAEVRAIGRALALVFAITQSRETELYIYSDSQFALGAVEPGCMWKIKASTALRDLAVAVRAEVSRWPNLRLGHVYGHATSPGNKRADKLAGLGRKRALQSLAPCVRVFG